ncbi:MAG: CatA-like O-acetyltransferase, family 3 [Sporomusaceae bacterium]|nr:CatA-like O-acetyltransferase, family 3 [Sporomusaceae bacterium]
MNYKVIEMDKYYRRGVFHHFSADCKCSVSMTSQLDVTELEAYSRRSGTKFYINFLYVLAKVLNSREDYRMGYLWQTKQVIVYDKINPTQYIFYEDTETCTPVYTEYQKDYKAFYAACVADIAKAKQTRKYGVDMENHPNWFDASYISWLSYDSLHVELPDGYLYFMPIVNWGRYRKVDGRLMMPVSIRLNHAAADGYLLAKVFLLLKDEILNFTQQ